MRIANDLLDGGFDMSFLQPPPEVIAFLTLKKFIYIELIAILAILRIFTAASLSRAMAVVCLAVCLIGIGANFLPLVPSMNTGPLAVEAQYLTGLLTGMFLPMLASLTFAITAVLPGARLQRLDALHGVFLAILLGLWMVAG